MKLVSISVVFILAISFWVQVCSMVPALRVTGDEEAKSDAESNDEMSGRGLFADLFGYAGVAFDGLLKILGGGSANDDRNSNNNNNGNSGNNNNNGNNGNNNGNNNNNNGGGNNGNSSNNNCSCEF